mmetsp:Transcript_6545/g.15862  ORF Transcript_6545/g.15862 Transcript_6545/m.15862 type:complete len:336 (-) Transcript_6545:228-1235(-)
MASPAPPQPGEGGERRSLAPAPIQTESGDSEIQLASPVRSASPDRVVSATGRKRFIGSLDAFFRRPSTATPTAAQDSGDSGRSLGGDESQQFLQSPSNARGVKKTWKMFPRTASVSEDNVAPGEDERHSASPSPGLRAGEDVRRRSSSGRSLKTTTEEWFASAVKNAKDGMSGLLASNKTESSNRVHPLPTLSRRGELACDQSDYPRWLMVSDIFKEAQEPNRTAETDAPHRLERTESVEKANKLHRQRTKMTMSAGLDAFSASMDGGSKEKKKEERLIDKIINDCQRVNSKTWNRSIQQLCVSRQTTRPFWKAVLSTFSKALARSTSLQCCVSF